MRMPLVRDALGTGARTRSWIAAVMLVAVIATTILILGTMFAGWRFGLDHADLATRVSTVTTVCAFILVAAAFTVAVVAYAAADGRPHLEAELVFRFCEPNKPVLQADPRVDPGVPEWRWVRSWRQTECVIKLHNRSQFAARNPGVRIELDGLGGLGEQVAGWTLGAFERAIGATAVAWEGGADAIVHGRFERTLPLLDVANVFQYRREPPPSLVVIVAADGYGPRRMRVPVRILDQNDYVAYRADLNAKLMPAAATDDSQTEAAATETA
jgi:hypothetical protein